MLENGLALAWNGGGKKNRVHFLNTVYFSSLCIIKNKQKQYEKVIDYDCVLVRNVDRM